jgi:hypothetical protein
MQDVANSVTHTGIFKNEAEKDDVKAVFIRYK